MPNSKEKLFKLIREQKDTKRVTDTAKEYLTEYLKEYDINSYMGVYNKVVHTLLTLAAYKGNTGLVKYLLRKGADIHKPCEKNVANIDISPLGFAIINGDFDMVKFLWKAGDYTDQKKREEEEKRLFYTYLLNFEDIPKTSSVEILNYLIEQGLVINYKSEDHPMTGRNLLSNLISRTSSVFQENKTTKILDCLFQNGQELDIKREDLKKTVSQTQQISSYEEKYLLERNTGLFNLYQLISSASKDPSSIETLASALPQFRLITQRFFAGALYDFHEDPKSEPFCERVISLLVPKIKATASTQFSLIKDSLQDYQTAIAKMEGMCSYREVTFKYFTSRLAEVFKSSEVIASFEKGLLAYLDDSLGDSEKFEAFKEFFRSKKKYLQESGLISEEVINYAAEELENFSTTTSKLNSFIISKLFFALDCSLEGCSSFASVSKESNELTKKFTSVGIGKEFNIIKRFLILDKYPMNEDTQAIAHKTAVNNYRKLMELFQKFNSSDNKSSVLTKMQSLAKESYKEEEVKFINSLIIEAIKNNDPVFKKNLENISHQLLENEYLQQKLSKSLYYERLSHASDDSIDLRISEFLENLLNLKLPLELAEKRDAFHTKLFKSLNPPEDIMAQQDYPGCDFMDHSTDQQDERDPMDLVGVSGKEEI